MTPNEYADRIFLGGAILTMERAFERVEAMAIAEGRILAVGDERDILRMRGPKTEVTTLGDRTLLPGFIDGHGHLAKVATNLGAADLSAPPVGTVESIDDLVEALRRHIRESAIETGGWVVGRGYDPAFLREARHPTRTDLDRVSGEHPIYIGHVSGHLAVANSLALEMAGMGPETPDPPGGVIRRLTDSVVPDGVLEENAMGAFTSGLIPEPSPEQAAALLEAAQREYAAAGLTTAQEGAMFPAEHARLIAAAESGELFIDVVGYAFWAGARAMLTGSSTNEHTGRFKLGGVKLMLDGSPQGKTAWLTRPYHVPPEGHGADYCGYPAMTQEQVFGMTEWAFAEGIQVIAHCNGDAAADQYLDAIERAAQLHPAPGRRPVMIHAQTVREDQLDRMAALGMLPSFFAAHVFYWGDYHRDSVLGPERAARISPLRSAANRDLRFNLHNDSPVVPPDVLRLIWCAVERRTRSGKVLGDDQRITTMEALRAVTIDAAYAHFEEETKGSILPGKRADLVLLGADPTRTAPAELQGIPIVETIKDGLTIHGTA